MINLHSLPNTSSVGYFSKLFDSICELNEYFQRDENNSDNGTNQTLNPTESDSIDRLSNREVAFSSSNNISNIIPSIQKIEEEYQFQMNYKDIEVNKTSHLLEKTLKELKQAQEEIKLLRDEKYYFKSKLSMYFDHCKFFEDQLSNIVSSMNIIEKVSNDVSKKILVYEAMHEKLFEKAKEKEKLLAQMTESQESIIEQLKESEIRSSNLLKEIAELKLVNGKYEMKINQMEHSLSIYQDEISAAHIKYDDLVRMSDMLMKETEENFHSLNQSAENYTKKMLELEKEIQNKDQIIARFELLQVNDEWVESKKTIKTNKDENKMKLKCKQLEEEVSMRDSLYEKMSDQLEGLLTKYNNNIVEKEEIEKRVNEMQLKYVMLQEQLSKAMKAKSQLQAAIHEIKQKESVSVPLSRSKNTKSATAKRGERPTSLGHCGICGEIGFGLTINCSKCGKLYHQVCAKVSSRKKYICCR